MSLNLVNAVGGSPIDSTVNALAKVRDEGFRRVWMAQMPFDGDLLTVLAVAMREVDGIEVGSAVLPIQNQHPMLMAQRALTLNVIAGGRFILGLGMTHQAVTEGMWGIPYDKPVRRMREYLDALEPLLAGEAVNSVGETATARGALQIPGAPTPDVYLAALGPQMLKLAGRRTAGTLTWMTGPRTLADHIGPTLRAAAAEAGRPEGAVRVAAVATVSVTDDVAGARTQAAEAVRDVRARCRPTARCSTARATPDPRTPRSSATRRRCPNGSTSWLRSASTSSRGGLRRVCRGARAHPRAAAVEGLLTPKFLWCDRGHRRTVDRTTGSGVTDPKSRQ